MADVKFISGLNFKAKPDNAPEYVIVKGSIKREDLIAWLQSERDEWVNFEVKVSKNGKMYAAVDTWKPSGERPAKPKQAPPTDAFDDMDVPDGDGIPW